MGFCFIVCPEKKQRLHCKKHIMASVVLTNLDLNSRIIHKEWATSKMITYAIIMQKDVTHAKIMLITSTSY